MGNRPDERARRDAKRKRTRLDNDGFVVPTRDLKISGRLECRNTVRSNTNKENSESEAVVQNLHGPGYTVKRRAE